MQERSARHRPGNQRDKRRGWRSCPGRLVSPQQAEILAAAVPGATTHLVPGQGHLLLAGDHAKNALQSALGGPQP